jgi:hypothetical protein
MIGWAIWEPDRKIIAVVGGQRQCRQNSLIQAMTIAALPIIV